VAYRINVKTNSECFSLRRAPLFLFLRCLSELSTESQLQAFPYVLLLILTVGGFFFCFFFGGVWLGFQAVLGTGLPSYLSNPRCCFCVLSYVFPFVSIKCPPSVDELAKQRSGTPLSVLPLRTFPEPPFLTPLSSLLAQPRNAAVSSDFLLDHIFSSPGAFHPLFDESLFFLPWRIDLHHQPLLVSQSS